MRKMIGFIEAIIIIILFGCGKSQADIGKVENSADLYYNNIIDCNSLITQSYPKTKVQSIQRRIKNNKDSYTLEIFQNEFSIPYLRKTYQGYYAVLGVEKTGKCFVFFDNDLNAVDCLLLNHFPTCAEFEEFAVQGREMSEVKSFDPYAVWPIFSSSTESYHIVEEGLVIVRYALREQEPMAFIVSEICFTKNEDIETKGDFIMKKMPYILRHDKMDRNE